MLNVPPPSSSPAKESSKPERPDEEKSGAGLATRATTTFRGENHSSRTRANGPFALSSHPEPHPTLPLFNLTPALPLVSSLSRFSHPNPFSSLTSDSESDDENTIVDPESDDEETSASLSPHPRDSFDRPVTFPQPFTLLCLTVSRQPVSLPAPVSALSSVSPSKLIFPLIADSGCTSILIQIANFPSLSPFFVAKSLPQVPFTLPDGSCLEVGCHNHITGELTFPHKLLPVAVYFLPPSSLSHSLFDVLPLIRPHGHAVFDNQSCSFFDSPQAPLPFLTGTKADQNDLWFLQVPSLPEPQHSPSILFSLQELPHAKFVAY